jgi:plasmid maintenance system antidote protein VapI
MSNESANTEEFDLFKLREAIIILDLPQNALAISAGVSGGDISNFVNSTRRVSSTMVSKIAKAIHNEWERRMTSNPELPKLDLRPASVRMQETLRESLVEALIDAKPANGKKPLYTIIAEKFCEHGWLANTVLASLDARKFLDAVDDAFKLRPTETSQGLVFLTQSIPVNEQRKVADLMADEVNVLVRLFFWFCHWSNAAPLHYKVFENGDEMVGLGRFESEAINFEIALGILKKAPGLVEVFHDKDMSFTIPQQFNLTSSALDATPSLVAMERALYVNMVEGKQETISQTNAGASKALSTREIGALKFELAGNRNAVSSASPGNRMRVHFVVQSTKEALEGIEAAATDIGSKYGIPGALRVDEQESPELIKLGVAAQGFFARLKPTNPT